MSVQKRGGHPLLAFFLILLILLILALPWIYLQFAAFPWDDYRTLAAENEYPFSFKASKDTITEKSSITSRLMKVSMI